MNDKDFLNWIADRFVHVIGESPNVDFVLRLRQIAETFPPEDQLLCGCGDGLLTSEIEGHLLSEGRTAHDPQHCRASKGLDKVRDKIEAASYHRNYRQACIDIANDVLTPKRWWAGEE